MPNKNSVKNQKVTYKKSGVSIKVADKLVEQIKPVSKKTFDKNVLGNIGGFGALYDFSNLKYKNPVLVSGTDGVGTKLKIASKTGNLKGIGIDLVAMCVNDIISQGAKPLFFLDYFATGKINLKKNMEILKGIAKGCKESQCALIGGETAEMPGLYKKDDFDLAGFCVGVVDKKDILPKKNIKKNDIIIGLKSSGFHSNGYSLINYLLEKKKLSLKKKINNTTYEKILCKPTKLYTDILNLKNFKDIKAIANITGGGMTENIPRVLPKNTSVEIDLKKIELPIIFKNIQAIGNIDLEEMLKVFNCGIGMIIIISNVNADKTIKNLKSLKLNSKIIGKIVSTKGKQKVIYKNK
tara:strand:- start:1145 stop:2200 length:1056 start_codon:yes stop_codon:yes gene_type:complete